MKIVFMGTPDFGAVILEGLIKNNYPPILTVTAPDKPVGRKQILTPPPPKKIAESYGIAVSQPQKIENLKLKIGNLKPDLGIAAAYGQLIPNEILNIPKYGFLNVHPSLLPKYRGPSPVQNALLNGDQETGVTIILMDSVFDHGPIIAQKKTAIGFNERSWQLNDRLALLGSSLLADTIPGWISGRIKARGQEEKEAVYTKTIKKEDGLVDWRRGALEIERQVRAFDPWPGVYTFWEKKMFKVRGDKSTAVIKRIYVKILEAEMLNNDFSSKKIGEVILAAENQLAVRTGKGALNILKLQIEGKKPAIPKDFLMGRRDFVGAILKNNPK